MDTNNRNRLSRRVVVAGLLATAGRAAYAGAPLSSPLPVARAPGPPPVMAAPIEALVRNANVSGKTSFVVADATSGRILESLNPLLGQPPASVTKAITAQYALDTLGPTYSFSTRLVGSGHLKSGRLSGDLILLGGGDPTLDSTALAEMATALKAAGVREVAGRFLVSSGRFPKIARIDPSQPDHVGYNPAVSGLNLNYNRVHFEWKRQGDQYTVTMDARTRKYRPDVKTAQMKIVDRNVPVYTYANGGNIDSWTVARGALGDGGSRWLPVRQPELYAGEVFQIFAAAQGIRLTPPKVTNGPVKGLVLVNRQSPPLSRILSAMLAHSNNLTAEVAGLGASIQRGRAVNGLQGSGREMAAWMRSRLGARKPKFVDHSGLGDGTRVSASDFVQALVHIGPNSSLASLLKPIPMLGADGKVVANGRANMVAKTGTLNFVSGLAGYIHTGPNKSLAFAIFSADMPRRNALSVAQRERPEGAKSWRRRARGLQMTLVNRWVSMQG